MTTDKQVCIASFPKGSPELKLCNKLSAAGADVDAGVVKIDYLNSGMLPKTIDSTIHNNKTTKHELMRAAISGAVYDKKIAELIKESTGAVPPWWFEGDLLKSWQEWIVAKKSDLSKKFGEETAQYKKALAEAIFQRIKTPKSAGGFGVEYKDHATCEANASQVINRGYALCSEFAYLYAGAALLAGLEIYTLEIPRDWSDAGIAHTSIMVNISKDERVFVEPELESTITTAPYDTYFVADLTSLFSMYLRGISTVPPDDGYFTRTLSTKDNMPVGGIVDIAPYSAFASYTAGAYYFGLGNHPDEAWNYMCRAEQLWPGYAAAESAIMRMFPGQAAYESKKTGKPISSFFNNPMNLCPAIE